MKNKGNIKMYRRAKTTISDIEVGGGVGGKVAFEHKNKCDICCAVSSGVLMCLLCTTCNLSSSSHSVIIQATNCLSSRLLLTA